MAELEKILDEMQEVKEIMLSPQNIDCFGEPRRENDCLACVVNKCMEIVKKHMNDGWIPVEERLPDGNENVLVTTDMGEIASGYVTHGKWITNQEPDYPIAWRPLPEPYRQKEERDNDKR